MGGPFGDRLLQVFPGGRGGAATSGDPPSRPVCLSAGIADGLKVFGWFRSAVWSVGAVVSGLGGVQ